MEMTPIIPNQGWHLLHLFYHIDYSQWSLFTPEEQREAKINLTELIQEIRATPNTQLLTFSVVSPKADLGFILLTPDLHIANFFEKQLALSLGPEILTPCYSYLSVTEPAQEFDILSNTYHPTNPDNQQTYPQLPDWPVICFYPLTKRRIGKNNWYLLDVDKRKELVKSQQRIERSYSDSERIFQLVTGSSGLDEQEWCVTLFSKTTEDIKAFIHEMRFEEITARYSEFGDFHICLQLPLAELFKRLCL